MAAGDPIYPFASATDSVGSEPGMSDTVRELAPADRTALQLTAEVLLGLKFPAYVDTEAQPSAVATIKANIVRQMNFCQDNGLTAARIKANNATHPGIATQYRDRYTEPAALAGVRSITGAVTVGFRWFGAGT